MNSINKRDILISIVSHDQGKFVHTLLNDLESICNHTRLIVVLTLNKAENIAFKPSDYSFPLDIRYNASPKGFAENHNSVLLYGEGKYLCIMNPDIRLSDDPFPQLIAHFSDNTAVVAPLVINKNQLIEDSARFLPTLITLSRRFFYKKQDYAIKADAIEVDWAAGMFLLFKSEHFQLLKGFDEKFYMYCEDIDICSRVWLNGKRVLMVSVVKVIHEAQRASRKQLKYFWWHLSSYMKLFSSGVYYKRLIQKRRSKK